jgi:hypothetical protein
MTVNGQSSPRWRKDGWIGLKSVTITRINDGVIINGKSEEDDTKISIGTVDILRCIPEDPILVRRSDAGDGTWEISYLPVNSRLLNIEPEFAIGFPLAYNSRDLKLWQQALAGDPASHNRVGMSLSFARGKKSENGNWTFDIPRIGRLPKSTFC